MSTLAPTISQTLAAHHRLSNALATFCTVEPSSGAGTPDDASHAPPQHGQACAYCGLLAHVPVLPGGAAQFAGALVVTRIGAAPARRGVRAPFVHTAALPRAPPAFS